MCVSDNHNAVCFCRSGYEGDPHIGCTSLDFCKDHPCASGASCVNSLGSYRCTCPEGTVGDPYNDQCKPPGDCTSDNDCSIFAYCSKRGRPKCKHACSNKVCGTNAECQAANHKAVCKCKNGYEGDADKGCRPKVVSCSFNSDCPPNTVCEGGLCRRKYKICLSGVFYETFMKYLQNLLFSKLLEKMLN